MQKRAINAVMAGVTGTLLAGMMVAGVAAASDDDAQQKKIMPSQQAMAAQEGDSKGSDKDTKDKDGGKADGKSGDKDGDKDGKDDGVLLSGKTTASYFWDDGSGINGDTGAPASGEPMQKGLFASPSWPLMTKVRVSYNGRSVTGFVGDRGPGEPSHRGIMLDLDTYTFRYLLDGEKPDGKYDAGTGEGHIKGLKWEVLKWGKGGGERGKPQPFSS